MRRFYLLSEGRSWPGGLGSRRFNHLALPSSVETLTEHLRHGLLVDAHERSLFEGWVADGLAQPSRASGVQAWIVEVDGDRQPSLEELAGYADRLALGIAPAIARFDYGDGSDLTAFAEMVLREAR